MYEKDDDDLDDDEEEEEEEIKIKAIARCSPWIRTYSYNGTYNG